MKKIVATLLALLFATPVAYAGLKDGNHVVKPGEKVLIYGAVDVPGCRGLPEKKAVQKTVRISRNVGKITFGVPQGKTRKVKGCAEPMPALPVFYTAGDQDVVITIQGQKIRVRVKKSK